MFSVEYSKSALKTLKKLDRQTASLIYNWIEKNLVNCTDPRIKGKGLTGNRSGIWRYRVLHYRILARILDDKVLIVIMDVESRDKVYKN